MATRARGEGAAMVKGLDQERVREAVAAALQRQGEMTPFPGPRDPSVRRLTLEAQRRLSEKLLPCRGSAGLTAEDLEKVREQSQSELGKILQGHKGHVVKQSARRSELLRVDAQRWRRQVEEHHAREKRLSPNFNFVILDTPALVLPTQDLDLLQLTSSPWDNVAKVTGNWSSPYPDNRWDSLSYVFAWENPGEREALINVESYLGLNGFCDAAAGGGYNHARLQVDAFLSLFEWWNNPVTSPPYQSTQTNYSPAFLAPDGGGAFGVGEFDSTGVSGSFDVSYRMFQVPPKSSAVFTVALGIYHAVLGDGYIDVDFASGDFQAMCPALAIAILS